MQGKRAADNEKAHNGRLRGILRGTLRVLVLVAALLLALLIVLKYDSLTPAALRNAISKRRDMIVTGHSERLTFAANSANAFAVYGEGLAVLSPSGLEIQDGTGEQLLAVSKLFSRPTLAVADKCLAAFDVGGNSIIIVRNGEVVQNISYSSTVIAADVAADGTYAVAADESGVRGAASVFAADGTALYKYFSAERFLIGCALDSTARTLAVAGVRQEEARIVSSVILMNISSETPLATWETENELILSTSFLPNGNILVLTETRAVFLNSDGTYLSEYGFGAEGFTGCAAGKDFVVLSLGSDKASSESARVAIVADDGSLINELSVGGLVAIDANGGDIGILTNDALLVYNRNLERVAQIALTGSSRAVLLGNDGAAFTLSSDTAYVYVYR